jgi:hypothetical protein
MSQARKRAANAPPTGLKLVKNGSAQPANAAPTLPQRLCACDCGEWFTPNSYRHKYIDGHRYLRFISDKKQATYSAVYDLVYVWMDGNKAAAQKTAALAVEHFFTRTCESLEQIGGWHYDTKAKQWKTWAMWQREQRA